jgi:hypothetical protein
VLCASKRVVKWSRDVTLVQAFSHVWWLMLPGINSRIFWSRKRQGDYLAHPWPCASRILYYLMLFLRLQGGWSSSPGEGKCCTILQLELEVVWPRRERKLREKGNSIKLVEWTPKSQLLLVRPFPCEDAFTFSTHSTSPVASQKASHTRAHKKNDPGFTSLTASQSFL